MPGTSAILTPVPIPSAAAPGPPYRDASAPTPAPAPDRRAVQRRTLTTLVGAQVLGGVGVASGIAVTALLARRVSGSEALAGLGTTAQVFGGALLAVPLARRMARRGRRSGLALGYVVAAAGAALVVAAAILSLFPLLLLGTALFGGATASNSQSRYAASDLAEPQHIGRDLSLVVWATTVGSVLGPNLVGPAETVGSALGLPEMAGSFVFSMAGFALAMAVLQAFLRPDPLLVARALEAEAASATPGEASGPTPGAASGATPGATPGTRSDPGQREAQPGTRMHGSVWSGLRIIASHPRALLGLLVLAGGHAVMVGVMVMTPLHMDHGGAGLRLIGLVISIHILGMYALSPVTGLLTDRFGGRPVAAGGALILLASCLLASRAHEGMSTLLAVALFLLGLGWSGTLVSGSTLITRALPVHDRPATQGVSDLVMGLAGGGAGAGAGVVLQLAGYGALALVGAAVAVGILVALVVLRDAGGRSVGG